jgi:SWI/SNF-related matrix-associated actin-dependent regulator 1 of chromatin subfamily A
VETNRANRYAAKCAKCGTWVEAGDGEIRRGNGCWLTYCQDHVPVVEHDSKPQPRPTRCLTADGRVIAPYEPNSLDTIRAMPGARWDKDERCWHVSTDLGDRERLLELADRLGLAVAPALRKVKHSSRAEHAGRAGLYPFQVQGVDWLSKRRRALLADEMGLGKTVEAVVSLPENAAAVVVAPKIALPVWERECRKWRPDLAPVVTRNIAQPPKPRTLLMVNYERLPTELEDIELMPSERRNGWRQCILIVDEAHYIKRRTTNRSKRVAGLAQLCGRTWGLTGTPLLNRPPDLWGVLSSLGLRQEVFRSWEQFTELFHAYRDDYGWTWGHPDPLVPELLRRVMLRRRRQDVLPDLPTKTYTTLVCGCNGELKNRLDGLWAEWQHDLEAGIMPPFEAMSAVRAELASSRIDAAHALVDECDEQECPLVVFSAHVEPVRSLGSREGWAFIDGSTSASDRLRIEEEFQGGNLRGIALSIKAAGVAITLTRAWKALFVDMDWTPAGNAQAEDRLCRIGQGSEKIEIIQMASDHPLDLRVLELLREKARVIDGAIEQKEIG